jgi:arylsulfatase A-like enzyme
MDQDKGRRTQTYTYSYTRPTCREHHIRYYQTITGLDHVIGRILADLRRRGLAEDTVIIYASDHGLLMGEYGMGGKALLYDLASKIPCFIYDPTLAPDRRGRAEQELVSSLDITRTILDYAGIAPPAFMAGKSLRPLVEGRDVPWRGELFLENLYTGRDTPFQEGIRSGRWKYIRMFDGVVSYDEKDVDFSNRKPDFEMLFDLKTDPTEMHNLIESHAGTEILASLRSRCAAQSRSINLRRQAFKKSLRVEKR